MSRRFVRRLRWAWQMKTWPWLVPTPIVRFVALPSEVVITPAIVAHAKAMAQQLRDKGWVLGDGDVWIKPGRGEGSRER